MKIKETRYAFFLSLLVIFATVFPGVARADVSIGSGFTCDGTSILKGSKTVSYAKARSTVTRTIAKLKQKLQKAPKAQKGAIKQKIKQATKAKTQLKACSNGTLDANQVASIFSQLAAGTGTFEGTYAGTVNGFIPLSGDLTFQFVLDGTEFSAIMTLGGNLGNTLNAKPLSFSSDVGGVGLPAQFNLPSTFLGSVTLSISEDGKLTITNVDTNSSVNLDAQFSDQTITGTLGGSYRGVPFDGSFSAVRK